MIIPVILENSLEEVEGRIRQIESATSLIQIDFADGVLTNGTTYLDLEKILQIDTRAQYDIHLMVQDPFAYLLPSEKIRKICTQVEAIAHGNHGKADAEIDITKWLNKAKENGYLAGLSLNPETPPDVVEPYAELLDFLQLMAVTPGEQGRKFDETVLQKIRTSKQKYPLLKIQVDGGINETNILKILKAGADDVVIGSAVFRAKSPLQALLNFERMQNEQD